MPYIIRTELVSLTLDPYSNFILITVFCSVNCTGITKLLSIPDVVWYFNESMNGMFTPSH